MPTNQSPCNDAALRMLVDGTLDSNAERAVQEHLDSCVDCRRVVNGMVTADVAVKEAAGCLLDDELDLEVPGIACNELNESVDQVQELGESITAALDRLAPSDHPTMLGRLGGYEVSGVVGAGAMGVVLKAFDQSLDRAVAVKVLAPHLASSGAARQRFAREAKAAAAVLHPNVMAIHSVSNEESLPYLVMPYLCGTSLQKRLDSVGPLPVSEVLRIGSQIAAGLAAAHAQGLVHRDIKPANILLEEGVERVAITDFGLARAVDDATMTRTGVIAGTPQYMSPEQSRGEPVDQRSDLFSLGSVLYSMCTGRAPFRAETSYGILRRITDTEPRSVRDVNPDIPDWLCRIIAKLMSKQPEDRFASAGEVAELLEECLAHLQQPTNVPLPASCSLLRQANRPGDRPWFSLQAPGAAVRRMLGAMCAIGMIFAGIVIVFELGKGTLTIKCEADNVPVRITRNDKLIEELTVSKAGASVRVAAGRYVVEIDGEFDGMTVQDGTVSLSRGGHESVKIVKGSESGQAPGNRFSSPRDDGMAVELANDSVSPRTGFSVSGQVVSPGEFPEFDPDANPRILDAIAAAGGVTDDAGDLVLLTRTTKDGRSHIIRVSIAEAKRRSEYNLPIAPGDRISVQPDHSELPTTFESRGSLTSSGFEPQSSAGFFDVARVTELRQSIEAYEEEARNYETFLKQYPANPNIEDIAQSLRAAHRRLAIHRDELATQIKLLELELKDAESAAGSAARDLQRLEQLVPAGVVAKSKLPQARREAESAQLRADRARTLLDLYQKVESPDAGLPVETSVDDSAARALRDKLHQRLILIEEAFQAGEASLLEVLANAKEFATAEVAAANSAEERRNAQQRQVDLLQQLMAATRALYEANEVGKADLLAVEVELLKAEARLNRETTSGSLGTPGAYDQTVVSQSEDEKIIPRWQRWEIRLETSNINTYASQLDYFKIELGAVGGGRETVDYVSQLSGAKNTRSGARHQEKRMNRISQVGSQHEFNESLLHEAGIDAENRLVLQFYPGEVADRLAWLEKESADRLGRTLEEVLETVFAVRPKGSGWEFFVQEQRFRPNPAENDED